MHVQGRIAAGALCLSLLSFAAAAPAATLPCSAAMTELPAAFEATLTLKGSERITREFALPPRTTVLLMAQELGVDVTLNVTRPGLAPLAADNPVRRKGIQRVLWVTGARPSGGIEIVSKEPDSVVGQVNVRAVLLTSALGIGCVDAHKALARGDALYARGQAVRRGLLKDATVDVVRTYEDVATGYQQAAELLQRERQQPFAAQVQLSLAALHYQDLRKYSEAIRWAESAAATFQSVADVYGEARANTLLGAALGELANAPSDAVRKAPGFNRGTLLARARSVLTAVADFHATRGEKSEQATALNSVGLAYYSEGLDQDAIRVFERLLPIVAELRDPIRQAQLLQNLALAEASRGTSEAAIAHYEQALALLSPDDNPLPFAIVLSNSALAHRAVGNLDVALRQYGQASELSSRIQSRFWQAQALHGLASIYESLGDAALALEFYQQALAVRTQEVDGVGRAATLLAIGNLLAEQGRASEALELHRQALGLATTPNISSRIRIQIAHDLAALGKPREALQEIDSVLAPEDVGGDVTRAQALLQQAQLLRTQQRWLPAAAAVDKALRTFRDYALPAEEFSAWLEKARLQRAGNSLTEALLSVDKALELAETIRRLSTNPDVRAARMYKLREAVDLKLTLLQQPVPAAAARAVRSSRDAQGLMISEQARARTLLDLQSLPARSGMAAGLEQQRIALYRTLAERTFQLQREVEDPRTREPRVTQQRRDIAALRQQIYQLNAELGMASTTGEPVSLSIREDLQRLPADAAVVEYWIGAEAAFAWVVTRTQITAVQLGQAATVNAAALELHEALRDSTVAADRRRMLASQLHRLIIAPLGHAIANQKSLVFVPDGMLHYVPFAALLDAEGRYLVQQHDVAVTPSLKVLLRSRPGTRREHTRQMLLVSDPIYEADDARLAGKIAPSLPGRRVPSWQMSQPLLARLPGTQQEAATIRGLLPATAVDWLDGAAATRERFLAAGLGQYRFIHIASHGIVDTAVPQLSSLILSTVGERGDPTDGRILAVDFLGMELHAELVMLSACDTALGRSVPGEGLVGMPYMVLARGARSVIASLWRVPDRAALRYTEELYSRLLAQPRSDVIAASSGAMRAMLTTVTFADPSMWSAFTVSVGDVRR